MIVTLLDLEGAVSDDVEKRPVGVDLDWVMPLRDAAALVLVLVLVLGVIADLPCSAEVIPSVCLRELMAALGPEPEGVVEEDPKAWNGSRCKKCMTVGGEGKKEPESVAFCL
jgi:hypothetical protein